jgi:8-oxo-dGTP pyrophosphatase MutT (NUDIX family)
VLIADIVARYLERNTGEAESLSLLQYQLSKQSDMELISRKNFVGHITASAFVISKTTKRVLLLEHKALGRMLQPGGHVDEEDASPLAGAYRELAEETGLSKASLRYCAAMAESPQIPFSINTQHIPPNDTKHEPAHYHHDFQYLFLAGSHKKVKINADESRDSQWTEWQDFAQDAAFARTAQKIEQLMLAGAC